MSHWPATRVTLLDRLRDHQDHEAWMEFVGLYGPLVFSFALRRLPQDEDAADVLQEVMSAIMKGTYRRPEGRFQKWLVTIVLNAIRDFHSARLRRPEVTGGTDVAERLQEEPSRSDVDEWDEARRQHLFRVAVERVQARTSAIHWDVFARTALERRPGQAVAATLHVSLTNVYAIKSRIMKEIKDEIHRLEEE